jgi:hypothetical protein
MWRRRSRINKSQFHLHTRAHCAAPLLQLEREHLVDAHLRPLRVDVPKDAQRHLIGSDVAPIDAPHVTHIVHDAIVDLGDGEFCDFDDTQGWAMRALFLDYCNELV